MMTVREVVEKMYRYLRKEQRQIPHNDPDLDDPLPEALQAINATLQYMAVMAPLFSSKKQLSAFFRAPQEVAVSGLARGAQEATATWPSWADGCAIDLPGDSNSNRIQCVARNKATLQFPHLSDDASGTATLRCDSVTLPETVVTVLPPVRGRNGVALIPATGRFNLTAPAMTTTLDDYGRRRRLRTDERRYFVESNGNRLRLMLSEPAASDFVVEYQARVAPARIESADPGIPVPVLGDFAESIFLPLVMMRWFGASVMRNVDAPAFVAQQAQAAEAMLKSMRPQGQKNATIKPSW